MAKDDFSDKPQNGEYADDNFYEDTAPEEQTDEALEENPAQWEQPTDDYVEEGTEEEEKAASASEDEDDMYAEGPAEEDYVQQAEEPQDDYGAHEGEEEPGAKKNKKSGFGFSKSGEKEAAAATAAAGGSSALMRYLPYIGGGIAALVIAFFGFQQFSGSFSENPQPASEFADAGQTPPQGQGLPLGGTPPTNQEPSKQAGQWDAMPSSAQQQGQAQQQDAQAAQMLGLNTTPPAEPAAPQPVATPTAQPSELENKITALNQQIEQMRQTQTDLEQKLQAAQAAPPPAADDGSKKALEDRIAQLEQKLAQANATPQEDAAGSINAPGRRERETAREPKVKRSTDFVASKTKRARKAVARPNHDMDGDVENYGKVMASVGWVLRSATPGAAWLSQGPYSSDLRRIVPGDKLPGLGTITSIRQVAGRWLVEGTQGSVR